jgi:ABC-type multidrug transport system fused ATPase/permease subunit
MKGLQRLLSRIRNYRSYFIASIVSNIFLALFTVFSIPLLIPFFQMLFDRTPEKVMRPEDNDITAWISYYLSDLIQTYGKEHALILVCGIMIVVFFLKNLFRYLALYFMAPLRNGIIYDIRKELFSQYLRLPLSFYSSEKKGNLLSGMTTDVQEIESSILNFVEVIFKSPIIVFGSVVFMLYVSPQLTLFVFVLMIFTIVVIGNISRTLKKQSTQVQNSISAITTTTEETLGGIRVIKGFGAEAYQADKFDQENTYFRSVLTKLLWRRDLSGPTSEFLGITVVTILLWYGSLLVFEQQLMPETFFTFVFAFYQVIEPSKTFTAAYYHIQKGLGALERVERVLYHQNILPDPENPIPKSDFNQIIEIENVTFTYPGTTVPVLKHINLAVQRGEVVALVGASGAGKSTLTDLMMRFYEPELGTISIDSIDVSSISSVDLRKIFGMVSQEAILFHDTIRQNITLGLEVTDEQVYDAARIANAFDFISALPQGLDTVVGDRGTKLSGGQRQRITIARAVLRNPPVLILDEATSALDSESERLVQDALYRLMEGRTSIVIAHRLSTIQRADRIIVLDKGEIIESGRHEELMARDTYYKKLVQMQNVGGIE